MSNDWHFLIMTRLKQNSSKKRRISPVFAPYSYLRNLCRIESFRFCSSLRQALDECNFSCFGQEDLASWRWATPCVNIWPVVMNAPLKLSHFCAKEALFSCLSKQNSIATLRVFSYKTKNYYITLISSELACQLLFILFAEKNLQVFRNALPRLVSQA